MSPRERQREHRERTGAALNHLGEASATGRARDLLAELSAAIDGVSALTRGLVGALDQVLGQSAEAELRAVYDELAHTRAELDRAYQRLDPPGGIHRHRS